MRFLIDWSFSLQYSISIFLTILILLINLIPTHAANEMEYHYFSDGSYIVTVMESIDDNINLLSTTVTKSKKATYYNKDGVAKWYVKVTGTFTYGNGTFKCTNSTVTAASQSTTWKISSKSGNKAIATATAKQYQNNSIIQTITKSVTLTCSSTGKFS